VGEGILIVGADIHSSAFAAGQKTAHVKGTKKNKEKGSRGGGDKGKKKKLARGPGLDEQFFSSPVIALVKVSPYGGGSQLQPGMPKGKWAKKGNAQDRCSGGSKGKGGDKSGVLKKTRRIRPIWTVGSRGLKKKLEEARKGGGRQRLARLKQLLSSWEAGASFIYVEPEISSPGGN